MNVDTNHPFSVIRTLPTHIPMRTQVGDFSYVYPLDTWAEPRGQDPHYWYDNLSSIQQTVWMNYPEPAVLARIAYEGCPTARQEDDRINLIEDIIGSILGDTVSIMVTAPSPQREPKNSKSPPFSYLVQDIDAVDQAILEDLRCISSDKGTIFITPKEPKINTYLFSIEGFREKRIPFLPHHLNRAFDECGPNGRIHALLSGHPLL